MARQLNRLTALQVSKLSKVGWYGDGGGLTLQITKTGAKSWLFRYMRNGKPYGMGLGSLHTVSLALARQKALEARLLLCEGINPLEEKKRKKVMASLERAQMMSFDECAQAYIAAHRVSWKNAKHVDQWINTLATYASPVFGQLPVAEIDTGLIVKCLSPIWETKTETASRVRGRIESILGWATTSGYRTGENPARWKGHLDNLLATISKTARTTHHASLPWAKISQFMVALQSREGMAARAVGFAIFTACRSGEVRGARWSEIDLKNKVWNIPAERMKAGRAHEVPLSTGALEILATLSKECELVFPGTKDQLLSDMSLTAVLRRMNANDPPPWVDAGGQPITVHGFRSSFRMWAAESTSHSRDVAEHALAHRLPDTVERAYQRSTVFEKRKLLMEEWAKHCSSGLPNTQGSTALMDALALGNRVYK